MLPASPAEKQKESKGQDKGSFVKIVLKLKFLLVIIYRKSKLR